jgi:hypothetical protein
MRAKVRIISAGGPAQARMLAVLLLVLGAAKTGAAIFTVQNTEDAGLGSLREAILTANVLPGPDQIHFNIPGPGPYVIVPLTELPPLIDAVTIDGTTQPGYMGVPLIALDGDQVTFFQGGIVAGLRLLGGNTTVRGLMIYSFGSSIFWGAGISIVGSGNVIEGNYIGLDPFDFNFAGNSMAIECLGCVNNRIGGPEPASRNVISHNFLGIVITNGPVAASSNNLVQGNFIGTDPTGFAPKPNIADAIFISGGQKNLIIGNRIAFNFANAIKVTSTNNGNTISRNLIHSNGNLGINLQPQGEPNFSVTRNDNSDADVGPNGLQNFPVITQVSAAGESIVIAGGLASRANRQYRLEFFRSTQVDPSGFGEGEVYLGSISVATDASGTAAFRFTSSGLFYDQYFTATATDQDTGDTSEFSEGVPLPSLSIDDVVVTEGSRGEFTATFTARLSRGSPRPITFSYATADGTAHAGSDYDAVEGTLTFGRGEVAEFIPVTITSDGVSEPDEAFFVNLSRAANAMLADSQGQCVIRELQLFISLNASAVELRFPTATGQKYRLEANPSLHDPTEWLPLPGGEEVAGTGEWLTIGDTLDSSNRHYRIRLLP